MGLPEDGEEDGRDPACRAGRCVERETGVLGLTPGCKDMVARAL